MSTSPSPQKPGEQPAAPHPAILEALRQRADGTEVLSFRDFMEVALYHPQHGYYRRSATRVARSPEADFYTAESLGPVFARLICQAAQTLLNGDASRHTFVELGAEPGDNALARQAPKHFAGYRAIRPGEPARLHGPCIVFANELLDAQPFHRLVFHQNTWHECGVSLRQPTLSECLLPVHSPALAQAALPLPAQAPEGYRLDLSTDAITLVRQLNAQPWHGLIILADYGRNWHELLSACPAGTARAYHRHQASTDLLAHPGQQDLTCHICWDHIQEALDACTHHTLERQEAFFIKHAAPAIEAIITARPQHFDPDRQTLSELLHPHHMGTRFQFLTAAKNAQPG